MSFQFWYSIIAGFLSFCVMFTVLTLLDLFHGVVLEFSLLSFALFVGVHYVMTTQSK